MDTLITVNKYLLLASQSPRRAQLLDQLGVPYQALAPDPKLDMEALEALKPGESAAAYVRRVCALKLAAAQQRAQQLGLQAPLLCADTTVTLDGAILGKPANARQARVMLATLSGRTHRVLTAVAVAWRGRSVSGLSVTRVRFAALSTTQIQRYVASGEPMGKAGAYAVQGRAAAFIEHISGSYSGVMGLPLHLSAQLLDQLGWSP